MLLGRTPCGGSLRYTDKGGDNQAGVCLALGLSPCSKNCEGTHHWYGMPEVRILFRSHVLVLATPPPYQTRLVLVQWYWYSGTGTGAGTGDG